MRRPTEEIPNGPLELVYIAGNIVDAETAERSLTEAGIDYAIDLQPFRTTSLLSGEYTGLFISVPTGDHARAARSLEASGLRDIVRTGDTLE